MASTTTINSWLEELALSFTNSTTSSTDIRKHNFLRDVKHHTHARTDQFAVTERLDGLEEKLQVLGLDDVAGELFSRRAELRKDHDDVKWLPDVLDLFLHLSNDPVRHSRVENLEKSKPRAETPPHLTWEDIEADSPIDRRDALWSVPQYSDFSSDEDEEVATSSTQTSPASFKQQRTTKVTASRIFDTPGDDLATKLGAAQFWQTGDRLVTVTETQAVREFLFALGGLPTSMFTSSERGYKPNPRYRIRNLNAITSLSLLGDAATLVSEVHLVRQWLQLQHTSTVIQLLQSEISNVLVDFDRTVSQEHAYILHQTLPTGVVSLLPVLQRRKTASLPLQCIRSVVAQLRSIEPVAVLNALYDTLMIAHSSCSTVDVDTLLPILLSALTLYAKPVDEWLHAGRIEITEGFFIVENGSPLRNLGTLWQDWFTPSRDPEKLLPAFLTQFATYLFTIGKTAAFLSRLQCTIEDTKCEDLGVAAAALETSRLIASAPLPFSATFEMVLDRHLTALLTISTSTLKYVLETDCGLTRILDAFDYLYLAKDGAVLTTIETKMFDQIDRCSELWNDRFLLSDALAEAYVHIASVDDNAITVQAQHISSRAVETRRRSVKILSAVYLSYNISWPLANIVVPVSMASYQHIALILTQLRRAKYLLEQRAYSCIPHISSTLPRLLFWQLLTFVNATYSHLTTCVLQPLTTSMRQRLASPATSSLDAMIGIHAAYITAAEHACLSSKRIKPLREALLSILDLCVRFTDLVVAYSSTVETVRGSSKQNVANDSDADDAAPGSKAKSIRSARSRRRRPRRPNDDEDPSFSSSSAGDPEGYSTFILEDPASLDQRLREIRGEFARNAEFLVAGLRAVARSVGSMTGGDSNGHGENFETGEMFELFAAALEGVCPKKGPGI